MNFLVTHSLIHSPLYVFGNASMDRCEEAAISLIICVAGADMYVLCAETP
jgi:hypothetical protein